MSGGAYQRSFIGALVSILVTGACGGGEDAPAAPLKSPVSSTVIGVTVSPAGTINVIAGATSSWWQLSKAPPESRNPSLGEPVTPRESASVAPDLSPG